MKCYVLILFLCLVFAHWQANAQTISGIVYDDANANGILDSGESGLEGVMVSNQLEVVLTDKQGYYTLPLSEPSIIFITKPSGYRVSLSKEKLPMFYYLHKPQGSPTLFYRGSSATGEIPKSLNFALQKSPEKDDFKTIFLADPQPESLAEVDFIRQDFVEEVIETDAAFAVVLGDIVFDHLDLFEYYNPLMGCIGIPIYNVIGNHDVNTDATDDTYSDETFEALFGPSYYSFDYGQVHFVALDSVRHFIKNNRSDYEGYIEAKQLQWLKNDLALVPSEKLVVLLMHIPLYLNYSESHKAQIVNRQEVFRIVKDRPYLLALAGHMHTHEQYFIDKEAGWEGNQPLHEIVSVTVSGSWWSGQQDERGVPVADQQDGVPNGYQIIEFTGNKYRTTFKACSKPASYQMRIHSPSGMISKDSLNSTRILVNIFDSSARSQVFYKIDNGTWSPMANTPMKDPWAEMSFGTSHSYNKPWVRPVSTTHIWSAALPQIDDGMHTISIKTIDLYGRVFTHSTVLFVW